MSFQRFIGLSLGERVPDAKTIWLFRNTLTQSGVIRELFAQFNGMLTSKGIITHTGTIVDATFVDAPRQRNSRNVNNRIKNGETPKEWGEIPISLLKRTPMPAGQRKTTKRITDIRICRGIGIVRTEESVFGVPVILSNPPPAFVVS